jgi:hypothetical protein
MDKQIPAHVKAQLLAEIDAAIARINNVLEVSHAQRERWQEEANQRARQMEAEGKLREMARELGVRASIAVKAS